MRQVYLVYQQVQPHTDIQRTFLATSFTNLDRLSHARTARVIQAQTSSGPPWSVWAVILLELAHPYVGEVATSPQPLRDVVAVLSESAT
jgi:hypothetical protein